MQNLHISITFLILILSSSAAIGLKRSDPIMLLPEKIAINPTEFYIKSVTDDRNFRDKVRDSRLNAAIFPSFKYDQRNQLEKGLSVLNLHNILILKHY
ncbi:MAG: hypothetical protein H7069_13760 [Phormidesmis sp. FL-bin-119]|nr:hypothetical protein [Pedobacter sp.]